MIAYLDTNVAVWLADGKRRRVSKEAERIVRHAELLVSPMVLLEMEYLFDLGRTQLRSRDIQAKLKQELDVQVCSLSFQTVVDSAIGEGWTTDPFDRIIVAHAKANAFSFLVSADQQFAQHYPRTVW